MGVAMVTYDELFQFCMLVIALVGFVYKICNKKESLATLSRWQKAKVLAVFRYSESLMTNDRIASFMNEVVNEVDNGVLKLEYKFVNLRTTMQNTSHI